MKRAVLALSMFSAGYLLGYARAERKGRAETQLCVEILQRSVKTYSSTDAVCRHFVLPPYHRAQEVIP